MNEKNLLMLHAGARHVGYADVEAVPTPSPEGGWYPIPHGELVRLVLAAMAEKPTRQEHALYRDGARYFGVYTFPSSDAMDSEYGLVVGIRNAHDKSYSAGLVVGSRVFICDNLAFSGEVQVARKHTRNIVEDLPRLVVEAVGRLGVLRNWQEERINRYKAFPLTNHDAHDLIILAVDAKVMPNAAIPEVLAQWRKPKYLSFEPRTVWSLFNAFTYVLAEGSERELPNRTIRLHGMIDGQLGLHKPAALIEAGDDDVIDTTAVSA